MNDKLIELCNNIEKCENDLCENNIIVCVKKCIYEFLSGDSNKYLWLKAQIEIHRKFKESTLPLLSLVLTIISLVCSILNIAMLINSQNDFDKVIQIAVAISLVVLMIAMIVMMAVTNNSNKKYSSTDKILEYIAVVLDDIDKNNKII